MIYVESVKRCAHRLQRQVFIECKRRWTGMVKFWLAAFTGLLVCGSPVHAAGITTHWYIGDLVWTKVATERPALATFLTQYYDMFRRGTVFPDAAQKYLNDTYATTQPDGKKKYGPGDAASHEKTNAVPGLVTEMLARMSSDCADKLKSQKLDEACGSALAFAFGMVNHMMGDGPWHATWIKKTMAEHCPDLNHRDPKDPSKDPDARKRHGFADQDIDICLAARLTGNPDAFLAAGLSGALAGALAGSVAGPAGSAAGAAAGGAAGVVAGAGVGLIVMQIPYDLTVSLKQKTASPSGHPIQLLCPDGEIFDPVDGGSCWRCPSGYMRNATSVKSNNACVKLPATDFDPATRHNKATGLFGTDCSRGQFVHLGAYGSFGYCYSCPKGYSRTADRIDQGRACAKLIAEAPRSASPGGKAGVLCPSGEFIAPKDKELNMACFSCPADAPTHYNQYPVNDNRVCQSVQTVACSKLTNVAANPTRYARLLSDMYSSTSKARVSHVWKYLTPAYVNVYKDVPELNNRDSMNKNAAGINQETDDFVQNAMKEPLMHYSDLYLDKAMLPGKTALSLAAGSCNWAFEHANDPSLTGSGNIPDSANVAKQMIVGIWDALSAGKKPIFRRTDSCQYDLAVDGQRKVGPLGGNCSF